MAGSMEGKICLVTGATSGIGRETALSLAASGAEVILGGRDERRAVTTRDWIISQTGNRRISYVLADFSDLTQVRNMAREIHDRCSRLDVLVNNAGAFFPKRVETEYGVEKTFLINHLAPFLLTNSLLDLLARSAPSRIVNVSSDAYRYGSIHVADLQMRRGYFSMKAYARSKLANILFTFELARRLDRDVTTANALQPGHVATDIWKTNFPVIGTLLKWVMNHVAISPEEGAQTTIYLASASELENVSGGYYVGSQPVETNAMSQDPQIARELWDVSENIIRGVQ